MDAYFELNKQSWNKRTAIHLESQFYDVQAWHQHRDSLMPIEKQALGDVSGKTLLHLQCHFGQDTLSWAHRGAHVTGIDLSEAAIEAAHALAEQAKLTAKFIACNVYDTRKHVTDTFDIVYTSYGTVGWLPDLRPWAEVIAQSLKPGGNFYIIDFHPVLWMLNDEMTHLAYPYNNQAPIETIQTGSYTDGGKDVTLHDMSWNHGLAEIMTPLLAHGLQLIDFKEYTHSPYPCFANAIQGDDGNYRIKGFEDTLPMLYLMQWQKPIAPNNSPNTSK